MSKNKMMVAISKDLGKVRNAIPSLGKRLWPEKFFQSYHTTEKFFQCVCASIHLFKELLDFFVLSVRCNNQSSRYISYKHERDLAGPGVYLPASEQKLTD